MGKKKKQSTKGAVNEHRSSISCESIDTTMFVTQNNIQFADAMEIKQENDIKSEPISVCDLVDMPAPTYRNATHVLDSNERDGECDVDILSYDVKVEEKMECDDKKEDKSKTNGDSEEEAMDNQPDQPSYDDVIFLIPAPNKNVQNTQKRAGDAHENPSKRHKCDFCEYSAQYKSLLDRHVLKHTGEKPHVCDFCPKRFTQKQSLQKHMKVHVEEFLFHCSRCLQGFDIENNKIEHEISCKIRRYECYLCKESFGSMKANMIRHMRVHSGNRPFECKECFKQFAEKNSLNKHMKLHAGPRSFHCSNCRLLFSHEEERNAHEEKCNRPKFECDVCGKSFGSNKSNLISHMRSHSGDTPFKCQHCLKQFKQKSSLNKHMASHTKKLSFKCLICRQGFSMENKRKAHQRNCHVRCYECYLCNNFFHSSNTDLKDHMRIHSGERPFQCALCAIAFTWKISLKHHNNQVHNK